MVPPGGNIDPDGDSICNVKLLGTAAWNRNCSSGVNELFVAVINTCKQPATFCGTNTTDMPFLSNAVSFKPVVGDNCTLKSSNSPPVMSWDCGELIGNGACIENILLPLFVLSFELTFIVGPDRSKPPNRSSKSWLFDGAFDTALALLMFCFVGAGWKSIGPSVPPNKSSRAFSFWNYKIERKRISTIAFELMMMRQHTDSNTGALSTFSKSSRPFSINSTPPFSSGLSPFWFDTRDICIGGIFSNKAGRKLLWARNSCENSTPRCCRSTFKWEPNESMTVFISLKICLLRSTNGYNKY